MPITLDIAHVSPGVSEALSRLRKDEKAVLWVPPSQGTDETLVYGVEIVDILSPTAVARSASLAVTR